MDLQPSIGELFDFGVATTLSTARGDIGSQFTLREWASEPGDYGWELPDVSASSLECVESIGEFKDEWGRYRQYSFEAITDDCRYDLVQYALSSAGIRDETQNQTFQFVVWPDV